MLSPAVLAKFDLVDELWNTGNAALLREIYTDDAVRYDAFGPEPARGIQQIGEAMAAVRAGFSDFRLTTRQRIGDDEWIATEWSTSGTHTGLFLGIPATGRKVAMHGATVDRLVNAKAVEERVYFDRLSLLQQLGLAPDDGAAAATA